MGLNCVAGTTEYDEDEGIGLVLYVNSESNLIVWKMSNGTKQGTVVPLTTDYQSMLKSEFENKTGITIDYIIIHPYTGETIDVESSITINSGDTPFQTRKWKHSFNGGNTFLCGEVKKGNGDFIIAEVYGEIGTGCGIYLPTGQCVAFSPFPEEQEQQIATAIENYFNKQVSNVNIVASPVNIGETIENFDTDFITL